jgi:heat shock protein HslJ
MACAAAVMNQEAKYLEALQGAERFTREGSTLRIYSKGLDAPLRFLSREP